MIRADLVAGAVEIDKIAASDIHGADAETHSAGIYAVEVDEALERRLEGGDVVETDGLRAAGRMKKRRRHARREEAGRAAEQDAPRAQLIDGGVHVLAVDVETRKDIGDAEIWLGHGFPECAQLLNAPFRRIAGDDGCIHGADRDAGDPIRMQVRLRQRLIDAGLICPKSASSL